MHIEIVDSEIRTREVTRKRDGQPMTFREQDAYFHNGAKYPERMRINLPRERVEPYAPGNYELSPDSFYVDRYGAMQIRPVLAPSKK